MASFEEVTPSSLPPHYTVPSSQCGAPIKVMKHKATGKYTYSCECGTATATADDHKASDNGDVLPCGKMTPKKDPSVVQKTVSMSENVSSQSNTSLVLPEVGGMSMFQGVRVQDLYTVWLMWYPVENAWLKNPEVAFLGMSVQSRMAYINQLAPHMAAVLYHYVKTGGKPNPGKQQLVSTPVDMAALKGKEADDGEVSEDEGVWHFGSDPSDLEGRVKKMEDQVSKLWEEVNAMIANNQASSK